MRSDRWNVWAPLSPCGTGGTLAVLCILLSGCLTALHPYNQPTQAKLRLLSAKPEQYTIRVADTTDYSVDGDGRALVNVPQLERGCATYLFGIVKVKDSSSEDVPAIHVQKDGRIIQKLSLNDLAKLPVDSEGYRLVRVK
jgi:hypothetical protein